MKLIVNDKEKEISISTLTNLTSIIEQIKGEVPGDYIIVDLLLNGRRLDENWHNRTDTIYVMDEDTLVINTEDAKEVAKKVFHQSASHLDAIISDLEKAADMFRMENELKANSHFAQSVDNLQAYFQVLQETYNIMGRDFSQVMIGGKFASDFITEFSNKLGELINTQQSKDWVLLADVIEYELIPLVKELTKIYDVI